MAMNAKGIMEATTLAVEIWTKPEEDAVIIVFLTYLCELNTMDNEATVD